MNLKELVNKQCVFEYKKKLWKNYGDDKEKVNGVHRVYKRSGYNLTHQILSEEYIEKHKDEVAFEVDDYGRRV